GDKSAAASENRTVLRPSAASAAGAVRTAAGFSRRFSRFPRGRVRRNVTTAPPPAPGRQALLDRYLAFLHPPVHAAARHDDPDDVEERPDGLERHAFVVGEVQLTVPP